MNYDEINFCSYCSWYMEYDACMRPSPLHCGYLTEDEIEIIALYNKTSDIDLNISTSEYYSDGFYTKKRPTFSEKRKKKALKRKKIIENRNYKKQFSKDYFKRKKKEDKQNYNSWFDNYGDIFPNSIFKPLKYGEKIFPYAKPFYALGSGILKYSIHKDEYYCFRQGPIIQHKEEYKNNKDNRQFYKNHKKERVKFSNIMEYYRYFRRLSHTNNAYNDTVYYSKFTRAKRHNVPDAWDDFKNSSAKGDWENISWKRMTKKRKQWYIPNHFALDKL